MEIVYRNFLRLISAGTFANKITIEPMSRFKWNQLFTLAATYKVTDFISFGILNTSSDIVRLIPKDIVESAYAKLNTIQDTLPNEKKTYNFIKEANGKFANFHLNHKLRNIVNNEIHSIDTSTTTLTLLFIIIDNVNAMISDVIDYRLTASLGHYLRNNGDKIDFVKTDRWLDSLGLRKPANTLGSYLTVIFGFSENEIPFMSKFDNTAVEKAVSPLRHTLTRAAKEPDIRDYRDKMNSKMHISDVRILRRFACMPTEVTCKFVTGVFRSLSNIEE